MNVFIQYEAHHQRQLSQPKVTASHDELALPQSPPPPKRKAPPTPSSPNGQNIPSPSSDTTINPPPVPPRPKGRRRPQHESSMARINVWDFVGPDHKEDFRNAANVVETETVPANFVEKMPTSQISEEISEREVAPPVVPVPKPDEYREMPPLPPVVQVAPEAATVKDLSFEKDASEDLLLANDGPGPAVEQGILSQRRPSIEDFKQQLELSFGNDISFYVGGDVLRLPSQMIEDNAKSASPGVSDSTPLMTAELRTREAVDDDGSDRHLSSETRVDTKGLARNGSKAASTRSSLDLYDSSVKNEPIDDNGAKGLSVRSSLDLYDSSVKNEAAGSTSAESPRALQAKPLSTYSDVDLYDSEAKNEPVTDSKVEISAVPNAKAPSPQSSVQFSEPGVRSESEALPDHSSSVRSLQLGQDASNLVKEDNHDEIEAKAKGLSILNHQLSALHEESRVVIVEPPMDTETSPDALHAKQNAESDVLEKRVQRDDDQDAFPIPVENLKSSPQIIMTPSQDDQEVEMRNVRPLQSSEAVSPAPSRPPPRPPIPNIPFTYPSDLIPVLEEEVPKAEIKRSSLSTHRDSANFDASSTISSTEGPSDSTIQSLHRSASGTTATSIGIEAVDPAHDQAQAELRRLQNDLSAAKARGDSKSAQDSLQKSIDLIRRTYLPGPQSPPTKNSSKVGQVSMFRNLLGSSSGSALSEAAANGNVETVRNLLNTKVNVDGRGKTYMTPLMLAAMNGHTTILAILRDHGADEFAVDAKGRGALHSAVASHQYESVKFLLKAYEASRPQTLRHQPSFLSKATNIIGRSAHKSIKETSDAEGSKPIHVAIEADNDALLKLLLSAEVNIESKNNHGRTPLLESIILNRRTAFDTLLGKGADVDTTDAKKMSPLHWAAKTGRVDMIEALLTRGAKRQTFDQNGNLPIHEAAWVGHVLSIEALLVTSDDLNCLTRPGETMLHIACLNKNWDVANYLLSKGNIDANRFATPQHTLLDSLPKFRVPLTSLTPLHYACCKGDYEMAQILLSHNALVNATTPEGVTALMMATESEDTNTVNLLLTKGAKVNASIQTTLFTALHLAARRGDLETVQQLCLSGANISAQSAVSKSEYGYGRTPLNEAMTKCSDQTKRNNVVRYLDSLRRLNNRNQVIQRVGDTGIQRGTSLDVRGVHRPVSYTPWDNRQSIYSTASAATAPPVMPGMNHRVMNNQTVTGQFNQAYNYLNGTVNQQYQQQWPAQQGGFFAPGPPQHEQYQQQHQYQSSITQSTSPTWYDPDPLAAQAIDSQAPPPYQPSPNMSTRLANQAPVHRPGDPDLSDHAITGAARSRMPLRSQINRTNDAERMSGRYA